MKVDDVVEDESLLNTLPCAQHYERSYMHKDSISHILVSHRYDLIFTASADGFLKFWKKAETGIEFVKTFRAHLKQITGVALSQNQQRLATICQAEESLKLFDVANFDIIHMTKLGFAPSVCEFVNKTSSFSQVLAIAEHGKPVIRLVNSEAEAGQDSSKAVESIVLDALHGSPVRLIKFNPAFELVVSTDQEGMIEVWDPETHAFPEDDGRLAYELISETNFFDLA